MGLSGLFPVCTASLAEVRLRGLAGGMPQPHPGTLSLEQKHSTDGSHHGEGRMGRTARDPREPVYTVHPLAEVKPWRPRTWLFSRLGRPPSLSSSVDPFGAACRPALPHPQPELAWACHSGPFLKRPPRQPSTLEPVPDPHQARGQPQLEGQDPDHDVGQLPQPRLPLKEVPFRRHTEP